VYGDHGRALGPSTLPFGGHLFDPHQGGGLFEKKAVVDQSQVSTGREVGGFPSVKS
jgi:hypothetical protein